EKPEIGLAAGGGEAAAADAGAAAEVDDVPEPAAGAAAAVVCDPAIFCSSALANCEISWVATLWIMPTPRPYWAMDPERSTSVSILTLVPVGAGSRAKCTSALAPPRPLASVPCAFTVALWAASSFCSKCATPLNDRAT